MWEFETCFARSRRRLLCEPLFHPFSGWNSHRSKSKPTHTHTQHTHRETEGRCSQKTLTEKDSCQRENSTFSWLQVCSAECNILCNRVARLSPFSEFIRAFSSLFERGHFFMAQRRNRAAAADRCASFARQDAPRSKYCPAALLKQGSRRRHRRNPAFSSTATTASSIMHCCGEREREI